MIIIAYDMAGQKVLGSFKCPTFKAALRARRFFRLLYPGAWLCALPA